jgi:hypothetical protein
MAASEARALGYGGVSTVSRACGMSQLPQYVDGGTTRGGGSIRMHAALLITADGGGSNG